MVIQGKNIFLILAMHLAKGAPEANLCYYMSVESASTLPHMKVPKGNIEFIYYKMCDLHKMLLGHFAAV